MATITAKKTYSSGSSQMYVTCVYTYSVSNSSASTTVTVSRVDTTITDNGNYANYAAVAQQVQSDFDAGKTTSLTFGGTTIYSNQVRYLDAPGYNNISGSASISRTGSAQTKALVANVCGTTSSTNITVPAHDPYTITFKANGGTGGPTTQQKTHGVNLTLTTSKPTLNGYTFKR